MPSFTLRLLLEKIPPRVIPWQFVDLLETDPARRVKLKIAYEGLAKLHPADIADIVEDLPAAERESVFETIDEEVAAETLEELDPDVKVSIVESLDKDRVADIVEEMAPDAAADLLAELPKETSEELLEEMPGQEAQEVRELLEYNPSTAGGMMNTDFVFVGEGATREEVLGWMRDQELNLDQLDTIVLLDKAAQFSGTVPVARLLLAEPEQPLSDLKMEPLLSLPPDASDHEVFEIFDKYNLRMLTIVDENGRPMGTVTVDDVVSKLLK